METLSVCIVAFLQLLRYSYFISQPEDQCSPAPTLGSWIFLLATLCFLWDLSIYPCRFMHMAQHWQVLIDIVAGTFLAEIAALIIWCGMERVVFWLTQLLISALGLDDCGLYEYWLHGLTTVGVSGALLWFIIEATDIRYGLSNAMRQLRRNWQQMWRMLQCICSMNSCDRRRTLKACRQAMFSARRQRCELDDDEDPEPDDDDDDDDDEDIE